MAGCRKKKTAARLGDSIKCGEKWHSFIYSCFIYSGMNSPMSEFCTQWSKNLTMLKKLIFFLFFHLLYVGVHRLSVPQCVPGVPRSDSVCSLAGGSLWRLWLVSKETGEFTPPTPPPRHHTHITFALTGCITTSFHISTYLSCFEN